MYDLRWEYVTENWELFIDGLRLGLWLAVLSLAVGSVIGLLCAFARNTGNPILSIPVAIYVETVRNIPLLLIVFFLYFGLPQAFPIRSTGHDWVLRLLPTQERTFIVALSIYSGAYLTEIFYAGLISVGARYLDAGRSLGLRRLSLARFITIPIMFRTVLPSLSNTLISLFKDTSIAVSIAVPELTFAARKISTDYFRVIEAWLAAGALYLIASYSLALVLRFLERRIKWSV
jgi:polar amino acid transport system permease protein